MNKPRLKLFRNRAYGNTYWLCSRADLNDIPAFGQTPLSALNRWLSRNGHKVTT